jgi:hypothetical protein
MVQFQAELHPTQPALVPGGHANGKELMKSFFASFCSQKEASYLPVTD